MNSPVSSEKQADRSWGWDHHHHSNQRNSESGIGVTMSVGLETRQFHGYDWGPTSTAVLLSGGEDADGRKPQIMSGSLMDCNIGQYHGHGNANVVALNGMLSSSGMSHNGIMAAANNPLANLFSAGARNYGGSGHHVLGGIRSPSSCSSSVGFQGHIPSGFGFSGGEREASALVMEEEQRHHLLRLMGMDQKTMFHNMVKQEDFCAGDFPTRIGLNLGGRTYFSTEDNIMNRFYKRPRAISPGSQVPRCQAEGCKADLSSAKHYHRRHKVCELHSKAATVVSGGVSQRFCQQCSRFHVLSEFDEGKRSCRKRLADHNRRRRKPQTNANASAASQNAEAPRAVEDQDTNSGSNHSDVQPEPVPRTEAQALLTGISLSPSLPLVLQNSNVQQQYLQQRSPNLSRTEMGVEYSRGEKYANGLEIAIPWLKPADSSSEFGGSEKNSSTVQQVSESGASSSNTVQVFSSIQNLLPSADLGGSDWMVNGSFSGSSARNQQHFGSADLNLQSSLEGQQVLSLLEKNGETGVQNNSQNAVEYLPQGGLNSKHGHSEFSTGFSGMQSFRSLGQSMYQNIL